MFKEVSSKKVPLTPELAREFAEMTPSRGERRLRPGRVAELKTKLDAGLFHSCDWSFARTPDGRVRVNGAHSSTMLASLLAEEFPTGLTATVTEFRCDTQHDIASLFGQFDAPGSVRSSADLHGAHASLHPDLDGMRRAGLSLCTNGITVHWGRGYARRSSQENRARLIHNHVDFIAWACPLTKRKHIQRPGIVAAMFATWNVSPEAANQFWRGVSNEDQKPGTSTRILADFLKSSIRDRADPETGRAWSSHAYYAKCIHAWNAWRSNKPTSLKYYRGRKAPEPQ